MKSETYICEYHINWQELLGNEESIQYGSSDGSPTQVSIQVKPISIVQQLSHPSGDVQW